MLQKIFDPAAFSEAWQIVLTQFPQAVGDTLYITLLATGVATLIGLPLGVLLVVGQPGGVLPLPKWLLRALDVIINLLRSIPFLILMILVIPLTRAIVGTSVGTTASIVPLIIAAFPFVARLMETACRQVDSGLIEAAQSMGATPLQIIWRVLLPEAVPAIVSGITISLTTVLGYSAMSGMIGGGGLGKIAINYGYYRYKYLVMLFAVIILVVMVQLFQSLGDYLTRRLDHRENN